MKKTRFGQLIAGLMILQVAFFACSSESSEASAITDSEANFLKQSVDKKRNEIDWTLPLNHGILAEKHDSVEGILRSVRVTKDNIFAGRQDTYAPVYPYLDGFGSLDISNLGAEAKEVIDGFCTAFTTGGDGFTYLPECRQYGLAFFLYDISEHTGSPHTREKLKYTSYICGKPIIRDDMFFVPVRFSENNGDFVDVELYLQSFPSGLKIQQINAKWKKTTSE